MATDAYRDVGSRKRMEQVFEDTEFSEKKQDNFSCSVPSVANCFK